MKLKFLGVGAALNTSNFGSSVLIDNKVLIDTPPACTALLLRDGIDLTSIDHIVISHPHGDHYFGLPFLLLEYMLAKRNNQLSIYGTEKLRDNIIDLLRLAFPESNPEKLITFSNSTFSELSLGKYFNTGDLRITPVFAKHSIDTFGFLVKDSSTTVYYSADTEYTHDVLANIEAADHIIIDATTRGFTLPGHISLEQVVECAKQFPQKKFYVTHRSRYSYSDTNISNMVFPADGDEIVI